MRRDIERLVAFLTNGQSRGAVDGFMAGALVGIALSAALGALPALVIMLAADIALKREERRAKPRV